ncbi:signal peptidase I [Pilimelia columellifera]|uniref:Signal peptidase I n=1 Tax=Pilimelia columellifera subsp. columellifera TaxID=706583 RepID=A0ABN3N6D0_9ACTN
MIDEQTDKRRTSFWREMPILLAVAIVVALLVRAFVLQTFYIPSPSMEHTLNLNDRVLVNKLVYKFRGPDRGEIVVFKAPSDWRSGAESDDFIKRVIGLPGDKVQCCDARQRLMINGVSLDEPYIFNENGVSDPAADKEFEIVVPPDRLWVMGDHRSESGDSLEHWKTSSDLQVATVPVDSVVGRAFVLFWPFDRATWLTPPSGYDVIPDPRQP